MWQEEYQAWTEEEKYSLFAYAGTYWYVAPTLTEPDSLEIPVLHLAMTLHNAKLNKGRARPHLSSLKEVNASIGRPDAALEPESGGAFKREAEKFLEGVRQEVNPDAPSRLACYFVSIDEDTASRRKADIRGQREIFPCRLLADGGVHFADITLFDDIVNSMGSPRARRLAEQYWSRDNSPVTVPSTNLEILFGGSLYFPAWEQLPSLDFGRIASWCIAREAFLENG
ncbi:hypothetical protein HUX88_02855 [Duganella sp. BJB1802]|uniref:hypothetical protein n=1 Tax=Duganella sp. BJB1802 TaxID=2744575 RepID=UPI00159441D7|nr:hypothetical protein [Duganella sp. BJB1802]NVD69497.1 hypothetical protein [Duganella sp. BJB1802]